MSTKGKERTPGASRQNEEAETPIFGSPAPMFAGRSNSEIESMAMHARGLLQRSTGGTEGAGQQGAPTAVMRAGSSTGQPLPANLRDGLEATTGHSLGGVRVHTDGAAADAASAIQAKAFTTGQDIYFGQGQFEPGTPAGQHLIAHETAHTIQQQSGEVAPRAKLEVSVPGDALEQEADAVADRFSQGTGGGTRPAAASLSGAQPGTLQRTPSGAGAPVADRAVLTAPGMPADSSGELEVMFHAAKKAKPDQPEPATAEGELNGLTAEELEFLRMLLGQAAAQGAAGADASATAAHAGRSKGAKEREEVTVQVPIDASLLESPEIRKLVQVRAFQAGLQAYGVDMSRMEVRHFLDVVAREDANNAFLRLGGRANPGTDSVRAFIKNRLDGGQRVFEMRVTGIPTLLATYEKAEREYVTAANEFKAAMLDSTYASDAILSFYIAHLNAPINAINDLFAFAATPVHEYGGVSMPRIPTIPYRGEWGQKYAGALDAGGSIGITLPLGAMGLIGRASVGVEASAARLTISGVRVGPGIVKLGKAYMVGAAALQIDTAIEDTRADIDIVKHGVITANGVTRAATPEERQAAYDRIVDRFLGVAAGVAVAHAATTGRGQHVHDLPPGTVVRGGEPVNPLGDDPTVRGMHEDNIRDAETRQRHEDRSVAGGGRGKASPLGEHIPPAGPEFDAWFDSLTLDELDQLLADGGRPGAPGARDVIARRIRHPGELHEWLMVSEARKFKQWGVPMRTIKEGRTLTQATIGRYFRHGGPGSGRFHLDLSAMIRASSTYPEFLSRLNAWADEALVPSHSVRWPDEPALGRYSLPDNLQVKGP